MKDEHLIFKSRYIQQEWMDFAETTKEVVIPNDLLIASDGMSKVTCISIPDGVILSAYGCDRTLQFGDFNQIELIYTNPSVEFFQDIYSKIEIPPASEDYLLVTNCYYIGKYAYLGKDHERSSIIDPFIGMNYNFIIDEKEIRINLSYYFIPISAFSNQPNS